MLLSTDATVEINEGDRGVAFVGRDISGSGAFDQLKNVEVTSINPVTVQEFEDTDWKIGISTYTVTTTQADW